jgi:hypothetical protein
MSATVLRELVAKLGFQVDDAQFKRASAGVDKIKASVGEADARVRQARGRFGATGVAASLLGGRAGDAGGRLLGMGDSAKKGSGHLLGMANAAGRLQSGLLQLGLGLGIGALIKKMVTLASDANETDNVLSEVFGAQGAAEVKDWAQTTSKWMGRSEYTLRKNASALGAMLEPMTGSADKAKEMSKNIGALAIDLASFFNTADDDALLALKAGLSGEAEPLRRYGIVLLDATLQEFAHAQGIKKKVAAMNVAEKTELRYQFILKNSKKAQGDAHRTMNGFANASRALGDNLKDLGTRIGQKLLPFAGQLIVWGNKAITGFSALSRQSTIVESAMLVLAAAFAVFNAQAALAVAGPLIAFALLALLVDDINMLFTGGQSAIGRWLDELGGVGTAQAVVEGFRDALVSVQAAWEGLADFWQAMPDMVDWWDLLVSEAENFGIAIARVFQKLDELVLGAIEKLANLGRGFARLLGFDVKDQQESATGRAAGRGMDAGVVDGIPTELELRRDETFRELEQRKSNRAAARAELAQRRVATGRGIGAGALAVGQVSLPAATVSAPVAATRAGSTTNVTNVTNGPISLHVGAGAGAADATRGARRVMEAERRATQQAIIKRGG